MPASSPPSAPQVDQSSTSSTERSLRRGPTPLFVAIVFDRVAARRRGAVDVDVVDRPRAHARVGRASARIARRPCAVLARRRDVKASPDMPSPTARSRPRLRARARARAPRVSDSSALHRARSRRGSLSNGREPSRARRCRSRARASRQRSQRPPAADRPTPPAAERSSPGRSPRWIAERRRARGRRWSRRSPWPSRALGARADRDPARGEVDVAEGMKNRPLHAVAARRSWARCLPLDRREAAIPLPI